MADLQINSESVFNFEQCLKCSVCTVYCPVSAVNPAYPGPKQAGPDGERYRLKSPVFFDENLKKCLNCKRCEVSCPQNVKVGDIIQKARMKYSTHKPGLRDRMLASTDFVGTMANRFAPIVNIMLAMKLTKTVMHGTIGVDKHRQFPAYSAQRFETWFKRHAQAEQNQYSKQVSYFHGCYVNYNYPKLGQDLVKIMNAVGYGVQLLDKEKCCGVAKIANGLYDQAKKHGKINIDSIRKAKEAGRVTLTTSSTCCFTIRDEYEHILELPQEDVRESVNLATRFLFQLLDEGKIKLAFRSDYKKHVAYHSACHMERMGWVVYSTELLKLIPGVQLTMLDSQCCGISGTYGFKRENYEVSQTIGAPLFAQIKALAPDCVSTDCETCKWQIEMSTGVPVENPISIIADALDVELTKQLNAN
ncbi:MAG: anaerobic glycerol-3-phosphate dehydrogenase subunit GlpC [Sodaliphilus sp.]|nr:anaerobic glycerol-3-phosphate dehydrogenase subunit GlpC [Sodaliphilus sp.]